MMNLRAIARSAISTIDRADLENAEAAFCRHKKGALELERNYNGEDHSEHQLEGGVIERVERSQDQPVHDLAHQRPNRRHDDNRNDGAEDENDDLFELLVERHRRPLFTGYP